MKINSQWFCMDEQSKNVLVGNSQNAFFNVGAIFSSKWSIAIELMSRNSDRTSCVRNGRSANTNTFDESFDELLFGLECEMVLNTCNTSSITWNQIFRNFLLIRLKCVCSNHVIKIHILNDSSKLERTFFFCRLFLSLYLYILLSGKQKKMLTLPGIKQHKFTSIYLVYVIDSIDIRVSMQVKMSECFANGWFLFDVMRDSKKKIKIFNFTEQPMTKKKVFFHY